jgi:hypothetical protein
MRLIIVVLGICLGLPAWAQMQTAAEVKPILQMTKGNWVAVRKYDGQDLLYFTHLEVFRCGLSQIRYIINDDKPKVWDTEPCEGDEVFSEIGADRLPYDTLPLGSVERVRIELTYDDGTVENETFERAAIEIN